MQSISDLNRAPSEHADRLVLYRTFGIERLFQMLTERKLTLLEPSKWDDPYERALQELSSGKHLFQKPSMFGLCWSMQGRSDALWRIYSPNKLGVRVSTTVERLRSVLSSNVQNSINLSKLFLGRVTYLPENTTRKPFAFGKLPLDLTDSDFNRPVNNIADAIEDMIERARRNQVQPRDMAKALFVKRTAFDHEREVRLLYVDEAITAGESAENGGILKLQIDPLELIRGIQFDPRLSDDVYRALRTTLQTVLGNSPIRITKSTLYKGPRQIIADQKR